MKKILFIVMALVYGQFTYAQSDDLQRRVYEMVGDESEFWDLYIRGYLRNDKTQDEAYEAPDSKLLKTWYLMDGQGWYIYDPSRYISYSHSWSQITFNANRTFLYVSKYVRWGDNYRLTINRKGTWKRSHQDLTLNFNNALTTVSAESSYEKKENMSAREKAECAKEQAEVQRILRLIKSKPETAKITRMDDNVMTLETGHYGLISGGDNVNGTVFYTENGLKEIEEVCREFKNASSDLKYYKKAAEKGIAKYQILLAFAYMFGKDGIAKDEAKAAEWMRKAAEQGDAIAQRFLGQMYFAGFANIAKDEAKAAEWIRKAAEQGDAIAQRFLGQMYLSGYGNIAKDEAKGAEWFRKAAEQGDADAQNNLGWMYDMGHGVSKDAVKALEWYKKAAEQGEETAQFNVGWMYYNGRGVAKDKTKAEEWFKKAAEKEHPRSIAYIQAINGKYDEAIATMDKAIQLKQDNPNYYDSKGEFLYLKGDKEGAKAMWEKVINLDPKYSENNTPLYQYLFPSN